MSESAEHPAPSLAHRSDPNLQVEACDAPLGRLDGEPPDDAPHFIGLRCLPPISGHGKPDDELVRLLQSRVAKAPVFRTPEPPSHSVSKCQHRAQEKKPCETSPVAEPRRAA